MVGPYKRQDQPELSNSCWPTVAEYGAQTRRRCHNLSDAPQAVLLSSLHTPGCMGGMCLAEPLRVLCIQVDSCKAAPAPDIICAIRESCIAPLTLLD